MFIMEPSDQNVTFGSLINLTCIVTGSPQPIISWFKDGQQISNITTPFYIIPSIQTTDRGQYYCRASNSLQTITSREALVIIRGEIYHKYSGNVQFYCRYQTVCISSYTYWKPS